MWGKVTNLGDRVNTPYDEDGVFIDYDGKTLFFSTRGRKGMGGYDIFKSEYDSENDTWNEPINLGYPINTPDDDIFFVSSKDGKRGYYATVRNDGVGYLDIYMVEIPEIGEGDDLLENNKTQQLAENNDNNTNRSLNKVAENESPQPEIASEEPAPASTLQPVAFLLKVEDASSQKAISAQVSLKNMSNNQTVNPEEVAPGIYRFDILSKQASDFVLAVEKNGYVYKSLKVGIPASTVEPQEFRKKVALDQVSANYTMILNFVYFDFNSANLKQESFDELNRLKQFMLNNPDTNIEIAGHTDSVGPKAYNKNLSHRRAQAIVSFLVDEGIPAMRLIAQGYGEEDPLASNDDENEGRELNRRVEMRILEKSQQRQVSNLE